MWAEEYFENIFSDFAYKHETWSTDELQVPLCDEFTLNQASHFYFDLEPETFAERSTFKVLKICRFKDKKKNHRVQLRLMNGSIFWDEEDCDCELVRSLDCFDQS